MASGTDDDDGGGGDDDGGGGDEDDDDGGCGGGDDDDEDDDDITFVSWYEHFTKVKEGNLGILHLLRLAEGKSSGWVCRVAGNTLAWSSEEPSLNPVNAVRLTSPSFARRRRWLK